MSSVDSFYHVIPAYADKYIQFYSMRVRTIELEGKQWKTITEVCIDDAWQQLKESTSTTKEAARIMHNRVLQDIQNSQLRKTDRAWHTYWSTQLRIAAGRTA